MRCPCSEDHQHSRNKFPNHYHRRIAQFLWLEAERSVWNCLLCEQKQQQHLYFAFRLTFVAVQCFFGEFTFESSGCFLAWVNHASRNGPHQIITALNRNHFENVSAKMKGTIGIELTLSQQTTIQARTLLFGCGMFHESSISISFPSCLQQLFKLYN